jgi:CCR4-NOT transcriptional regulation complex NOT5 subunit
VGPATSLCQVIIKNTTTFKDVSHSASCATINRSQSLLTTNRIPVLAPPRGERIRLETLLSDVWSRDILPFPSMTSRARNEHPVRVSASSMMRKLSVASIASNFTKRSASIASLQKASEEASLATLDTRKPSLNNSGFGSAAIDALDEKKGLHFFDGQDDKENTQTDSDSCRAPTQRSTSGTLGSMRRLATLKVKKSWTLDGHRIITPPLRTSSASANSLAQSRKTSLSTVTDAAMEEKESPPPHLKPFPSDQRQQKLSMWKGNGKRGIRNLFR